MVLMWRLTHQGVHAPWLPFQQAFRPLLLVSSFLSSVVPSSVLLNSLHDCLHTPLLPFPLFSFELPSLPLSSFLLSSSSFLRSPHYFLQFIFLLSSCLLAALSSNFRLLPTLLLLLHTNRCSCYYFDSTDLGPCLLLPPHQHSRHTYTTAAWTSICGDIP